MVTRIAINGFGRIGRCVTRVLFESKSADLELVAINDLTDPATLAHLLAYDSVHRKFGLPVSAEADAIVIGGKRVPIFKKRIRPSCRGRPSASTSSSSAPASSATAPAARSTSRRGPSA